MNYIAAPAAAADDNVFYDSERGGKLHTTAHLRHTDIRIQHFKDYNLDWKRRFYYFTFQWTMG